MTVKIARTALICAGWTVACTEKKDWFDVLARDPVSRQWETFQVIKSGDDYENNEVDRVIFVKYGYVWIKERDAWRELPLKLR